MRLMTLLLLASLTGCLAKFAPLSSHTLTQPGASDADVIWILQTNRGKVLRCTNTPQGPVCRQAATK